LCEIHIEKHRAGWLVGKIVKGGGLGLVGDLVVGVVGSFIGG